MPIIIPRPPIVPEPITDVYTAEIAAGILQTKAFIEADPTDVALVRRQKVKTADGGYIMESPGPMSTQTVRMIPRQDKQPATIIDDGQVVKPEFTMLGMPDLDVERHDTFDWDNVSWKVVAVHRVPVYEAKADVVRNG